MIQLGFVIIMAVLAIWVFVGISKLAFSLFVPVGLTLGIGLMIYGFFTRNRNRL